MERGERGEGGRDGGMEGGREGGGVDGTPPLGFIVNIIRHITVLSLITSKLFVVHCVM